MVKIFNLTMSVRPHLAPFDLYVSPGMGQLLTPHHHLLTLAPTEFPLSLTFLLYVCQPQIARLYSRPCARGITIWRSLSVRAERIGASYLLNKPYLIPCSDQHYFPPCICVGDAMQVALLET